jgi:hypothetical protein
LQVQLLGPDGIATKAAQAVSAEDVFDGVLDAVSGQVAVSAHVLMFLQTTLFVAVGLCQRLYPEHNEHLVPTLNDHEMKSRDGLRALCTMH